MRLDHSGSVNLAVTGLFMIFLHRVSMGRGMKLVVVVEVVQIVMMMQRVE